MADPVFQVEDLLVELSDGRIVEAQPVRIVEGTVAQNSVGNWIEVQPVTLIQGNPDAALSMTLDNGSVPENAAAGTVIGTITLPGEDWTAVLVPGFTAGGRVAMVGNDLVTTATPFDFEVQDSFDIRVVATLDDPFTQYTRQFTITVEDVVEALTFAISATGTQAIDIDNFDTVPADNSVTFTIPTGLGISLRYPLE